MFHRFLIWLAHSAGLDPRGLFKYFDGRRQRYCDPMIMARAIWSLPFDIAKTHELMSASDGITKLSGYAELAAAVRTAWKIQTYANGGLTDLECARLYSRFEDYLGDLKKSGSPGQTSQPFTVPDVSHFEVTNPESDSGSTSTVSS